MAKENMSAEELRELFAKQAEQVQKLTELVVPRFKEINDTEGKLPPGIVPLTESEVK